MFEPFVQKSNFSSGAGLGAFIAQSIVHRMRGDKIDVQSTVGQGSTFSIVLPMKMSDERKNMDQKPQMIKTTIKGARDLCLPYTALTVPHRHEGPGYASYTQACAAKVVLQRAARS